MSTNTAITPSGASLLFQDLGHGEPMEQVNGTPVVDHVITETKRLYSEVANALTSRVWFKLTPADDYSDWHRLGTVGYKVQFHENAIWNDGDAVPSISISPTKKRPSPVKNLGSEDPINGFELVVEFLLKRLKSAPPSSSLGLVLHNALEGFKDTMRDTREGLKKKEIVGLYGELVFLKWLMGLLNDSHKALRFWKGYKAESKDFVNGAHWAVEVKSSLSANCDDIWINGLKQLDSEGADSLLLCHLHFDSQGRCKGTLSTCVDEVARLLNPTARTVFTQDLHEFGYDPQSATNYDIYRFPEPTWTWFNPLLPGFPRLTKSSAQGAFPLIHDMKYRLKLPEIEEFQIKGDFARNVIAGNLAAAALSQGFK